MSRQQSFQGLHCFVGVHGYIIGNEDVTVWHQFCNWPNSQIPECTCSISQNAPFRTEMCKWHQFCIWPNLQIPECTCSISQNAPFRTRNVHISVLNGAFWDMEQAHSGICDIGLLCCIFLFFLHSLTKSILSLRHDMANTSMYKTDVGTPINPRPP